MRPRWLNGASFAGAFALFAAAMAACNSPVNDDAIDALGGEAQGVPESEFHRPGQPCLLCHGDYKGDGPTLSVAGTVFATPRQTVPVGGARVTLTDSEGETFSKITNCVGNFYITADEWMPAFPLRAELECPLPGTNKTRRFVMGTRIGRDGSCAGCHTGAPSQSSPGWVYCAETMPSPAYTVPDTCQGVPR